VKEPAWIDAADCLAFHEEMLARFGGLAGIRDKGLLDSALNRPLHLFAYGKPNLFELAIAYAAGIIKNHLFLDGNKRAGFMAAALFLDLNDLELAASEEEVVLQTISLAAGDIRERDYAAWLKASCKPRPRAQKRK
jgi:death on curing protein